tara:strand:+ start:197 stop:430 length:234 start_codon:yes stop_codon:yes gene_type:complete
MSSKQEEIDMFDHTIQTPVKHLTVQGYYDNTIHETPNSATCKCWNVIRMVTISFILGIITGIVVHPYVMPFLKEFVD